MITAMRLMYAGAALAALGILAAAATVPALRAAVRQQYPDAGYGGLRAATTGALTVTIVGGLISVGVWLAVARRTRRGRPGVRVVSTVLFVIDSLGVLSTHSHGFLTPATWIDRRGRMGRRPDRHRVPVGPAVDRVLRRAAAGPETGDPAVAWHTAAPPPAMPHRRP